MGASETGENELEKFLKSRQDLKPSEAEFIRQSDAFLRDPKKDRDDFGKIDKILNLNSDEPFDQEKKKKLTNLFEKGVSINGRKGRFNNMPMLSFLVFWNGGRFGDQSESRKERNVKIAEFLFIQDGMHGLNGLHFLPSSIYFHPSIRMACAWTSAPYFKNNFASS